MLPSILKPSKNYDGGLFGGFIVFTK